MTAPRLLFIWVSTLILAILSANQLSAQIEPKISVAYRNTFRSPEYHPSGTDSLSRFRPVRGLRPLPSLKEVGSHHHSYAVARTGTH